MSWLASHSIPSSLPPPLSSCSRGRCSSVPPCHTETQKQKQKHRKKTQNNSPYIVLLQQCGVFLLVKHTEKEKQKQREKPSLSSCRIRCFKYILLHYQTHTEIKRLGHLVRDTELTNEKREELLRLTKEEKTSEILSSASWRRSLKWLTFKWTRGSCCQRNTETGELNIEHWTLNIESKLTGTVALCTGIHNLLIYRSIKSSSWKNMQIHPWKYCVFVAFSLCQETLSWLWLGKWLYRSVAQRHDLDYGAGKMVS